MSAKVVKLTVAGQTIDVIISSTHLELFLVCLLKKVFRTAVVSDYFFEPGQESSDNIVKAEVKSCWYKRQTKYKYTIVCKAVINSRSVTLLYHKMLLPSKAYDLRNKVLSATSLNMKYWSE